MKIGELARSTGATVKTIRFYEDQGLLPAAPRTESGYRIYGTHDVERLEFIRKAKRIGMSLEEIRGVLQLSDRDDPTCVHVRALLDEKIARLDRALDELRDFRIELVALRDGAGVLEDCHPTGANVCGIVERSEIALDDTSAAWLRGGWSQRA